MFHRALVVSGCLFAMATPGLAWEPMVAPLTPKTQPDGGAGERFVSLAAATAEDFLLIWWEISPDEGTKMRRFDWQGAPLTPVVDLPDEWGLLSGAADGSFVMAGIDFSQAPPPFVVNRYDRLGKLLSSLELDNNAHAWDLQHDSQGNFIVAWSGSVPDHRKVWALRFNAAGAPQGKPIAVGTSRSGTDRTELAIGPDGSFTVFFEADDSPTQLYMRRFDALGEPIAEAVPVPPERHQETRVAAAPDGALVALFTVANRLAGQYFDPEGGFGPAFGIPNTEISWLAEPDFLASGDVVAASLEELGPSSGIQLHRLDLLGQPRGRSLLLSGQTVQGIQSNWPDIATHGEKIVATWTYDDSEVFFQVFEATLFADNFESGDLSSWSVAP